MVSRKKLAILPVFVVVLAVVFSGPRSASAATCDVSYFDSLGLSGSSYTGVQKSASPVSHCDVTGKIDTRKGIDGKNYGIGFHLRLPDNWNKRFYFQGGAGTDGDVGDALGGGAMAAGYAVVSTDAGHSNDPMPAGDSDPKAGGASAFGVDPQARLDYGYHALDVVTRMAKILVRAYYGSDPAYSYFVGCSNGGRQGMVASQRFPTYFNGIVAGAPGFNLPKAALTGPWNAQALAPLAARSSTQGEPYLPDAFSDADFNLARKAILAACDGLDGAVDGISGNPAACTSEKVSPELKAVTCSGDKNAGCLSPAQVQALKTIYAGPVNSRGEALYAPWQWDGGITAPTGLRLWSLGMSAAPDKPLVNNAIKLTMGASSLAHVFVTPPMVTPMSGIEAYAFHFNFDTDAPRIFQTSGVYGQSSMEFMAAHAIDLSPFRSRGGKMLLYQGCSDGSFSPLDTIDWYKSVNAAMAGDAGSFARLFLVPGMGHCGTGPGTTQFNVLSALVEWVEGNRAPERILAAAPPGTPWPGRTRPLCPYPEIAAYSGSGSMEMAESFVCAPPITVRLAPNRPDLKTKGEITASVTLPQGYAKEWAIGDASLEGGAPVKGVLSKDAWVFKFSWQDLPPGAGDTGSLTLRATLVHGTETAKIQGWDRIEIVK